MMRPKKIIFYLVFMICLICFVSGGYAQQDIHRWLIQSKEMEFPDNISTMMEDLRLSYEVGKKLIQDDEETFESQPFRVDFSTTPPETLAAMQVILEKALQHINLNAYETKEWGPFRNSLKKALQAMSPVARFAKKYSVFVLGNAHIDMAWLWRWPETVEICRATFQQQLKLMEAYPAFTYAQSQAQAYRWMEEKYPELFKGIKKKVETGQWEVVGGMVVEPDCNLISGESWVRQILYGKQYFRKHFGVDVKLGWNPDSFGYNWNMPQFFKKSGIDAFITQKISWNDTNEFPYHLFWWEGADGSRVLTYFPYTGYVGRLKLDEFITSMKRNEANTGRKEVLILFGVGDHGGGPEREMLERLKKFRDLTIFPKVRFTTAQQFINNLSEEELRKLPVWKEELYLEYHRGTYTTQAAVKKANRKNETLLTVAEKLASVAATFDHNYPAERLEQAWWKLLFNQFHDILPGSSIASVYRDAAKDYEQVAAIGDEVIQSALSSLADQVKIEDKSDDVRYLMVFNPLSWKRDDVVSIPIEDAEETIQVMNPMGQIIPSQILETESDKQVLFLAEDLPAMGYKVFRIKKVDKVESQDDYSKEKKSIENRFFRLSVNKNTGNITSIYDKVHHREVLDGSGEGNMIHLFEDIPSNWDAWNIGYTGKDWKLNQADQVQLLDDGPVFSKIRVKKSFLGPSKAKRYPTEKFPSSFFTQDIFLYHDHPIIEVQMKVDWWEDHILAKLVVPVSVTSEVATYEIPFAAVTRPTTYRDSWEKARFEVPALRWADLSETSGENNYGVSLINDSKYGYDVHGNRMSMTLLRSPKSPDPMADQGVHRFRYTIYPHAGNWQKANTVQVAREFNTPLQTCWINLGDGTLPTEYSFLAVSNENVVLADIKKAENDHSLILRFYESRGKKAKVSCKLWRTIDSASKVDLMENEIGPVRYSNKTITFSVEPFEIRSIKINFRVS